MEPLQVPKTFQYSLMASELYHKTKKEEAVLQMISLLQPELHFLRMQMLSLQTILILSTLPQYPRDLVAVEVQDGQE